MTLTIRSFAPSDTLRLIEILTRVFGEYGMRFDPEGYDKDVKDVATRYAAPRGVFFTAEDDGAILGFGGADLPEERTAEIHRLYLDPAARGRGLGMLLVAEIEAWARPRAANMILWSDVRFFHAHDLYARLGYRLTGQRILEDPDRSVEFGFRRRLADTPDDRPFVAELSYKKVSELSKEERHRAAMVAAAIADSRKLARGADGAHVLPDISRHVEAVFQRRDVLVGFRDGAALSLHPLFSTRLAKR